MDGSLIVVGYTVSSIEDDFADGVRLILLMGSLEGFFIPFYNFHLHPTTKEERLENINYAFKLIEEIGLPAPRNRPNDVMAKDLKSILRVVYSLFIKYKN